MSSLLAWFSSLSAVRKFEIFSALGIGAYAASRLYKSDSKPAQEIALLQEGKKEKKNEKKPPQYTELWRRLKQIFQIIFPSWKSREMMHLGALTFCLVSRTLISIKVAETTGQIALHLVQADWKQFVRGVAHFSVFVGIPASIINSLLKFEVTMLSLCFRDRLTRYINNIYVSSTNFYKATNLAQSQIENIDQRVTADIEKFCEDIANLYSSIFKPVLDIVLNTAKLTSVIGLRGPVYLVLYYVILGQIKMRLMPNFKKLTEQQSELEGTYRTCHSRLIANSEEISFYDGANREKGIISDIFSQLYAHCASFARQRAIIGIIDQYLIKYGSSVAGYFIMCLPVFFPLPGSSTTDGIAGHTRDFVRNRQLLMDLAGGVGTLLSTTNKIASLAGSTSRVCEVVDAISELDHIGTQPFLIRNETKVNTDSDPKNDASLRLPSSSPSNESRDANVNASMVGKFDEAEFLKEWCEKGDAIRVARAEESKKEQKKPLLKNCIKFDNNESAVKKSLVEAGGTMELGDTIKFQNATIVSPDGRVLVVDLNLEVPTSRNIMITGPNGSGKSSLFRVLGELWPLHSGNLVKPGKHDIMFLPQKPYQVLGSLRDQIIYPHDLTQMKQLGVSDEDLCKLLALVDPANSILRQWKLDDVRNWFNAFSGGQKQRIAMARVFYHRPRYAILDECTSAVSEEVEGRMYTLCSQLKVTLFTVSHRASLQVYHDYQLKFDGFGKWEYLSTQEVKDRNQKKAIEGSSS